MRRLIAVRDPLKAWELFVWAIGAAGIAYWFVMTWGALPLHWEVLVAAGMLGALLFRRRSPIIAFLFASSTAIVPVLLQTDAAAAWTVAQLVLFSLTLRVPARVSVWFAAALAALLLFLSVVVIGGPATAGLSFGVVAWTFGVWGLASSVAAQRAVVGALAEHAEELVRSRENEIARRLAEQRLQIARDLHDELAHNIAVISVSAGAAEQTLSADPSKAAESLQAIRQTARSVLSELQQIVGLLRSDGSEAAPPLTPGSVVAGARDLGLRVAVAGDWVPSSDPGIDRTAARILQEALTNARRHGSKPEATIRFGMTAGKRWMTVQNPSGPGRSTSPHGSAGFGLRGMRERAELVGAKVTARDVGNIFTVRFETGPQADGTEEAER